jgi:arylsulfatase I/J
VGIAGLDESELYDHAAAKAKLPPVDSINLWPYLSGEVGVSPRDHVVLGTGDGDANGIIVKFENRSGLWKRVEGILNFGASWTPAQCPYKMYITPGPHYCHPYCLFRLDTDPSEKHDLQPAANASLLALADELETRLVSVRKTGFHPDRGQEDPMSCISALASHDGFWGPWVTPS